MSKETIKRRLENKTVLTAFGLSIIALIYHILGLFNVVTPVSQDQLEQVIYCIVNLLVVLGLVSDGNINDANLQDSSHKQA